MNGNPYLGLEAVSDRQQRSRRPGVAAFLCDDQAIVRSMTPAAEALLDAGGPLFLRDGLLSARTGGADLGGVIRLVAGAADGQTRRTLLIPAGRDETLALDITPLLGVAGASLLVLVTVRGRPADQSDHEAVLQASFNLTAAEAAIAVRLARGSAREVIARERGVSLGTIKSQIRSVYQKVGVTREVELAACLSALS